jgi:STE24 endopeptidase
MQFLGLTCLASLTAMAMFQSYALDRQIEVVQRQRSIVLSGFIGGETAAARQYSADRIIRRSQAQRLAILSSIVAIFILLIFGCRAIDDLATRMTPPGVARNTLILSLLLALCFVASLPSRYYGGQDHAGTGIGPYLDRQARILAFGIMSGVPLIWALLSMIQAAGELWWLYVWCSLVIVLILAPTLRGKVIIPGISVMIPASHAVTDQVTALMKQLGFRTAGVFEWTPGAWAGDVGVIILGVGPTRRVVIPASLLRSLSVDEVTAVVAHELGHRLAAHGWLQSIGRALKLFVMLGLCGWLTSQSWVLPASGVTRDAPALSLLAAFLLLDVVLKLLTVIEHAVVRHFDFEADSFVNGLLGPEALTHALLKLSADSRHRLTPDPLYSLINDPVPPAVLRIARLQATAPALMPAEQIDEAVPVIEQLAWIGRSGLLTFREDAGPATAMKKKRRKSSTAGTKRGRASVSVG